MITDARHSIAEDDRKMRPFWRDGRIIRWPARESRLLLVLSEVVRTFAPGRRIPTNRADTPSSRSRRTRA